MSTTTRTAGSRVLNRARQLPAARTVSSWIQRARRGWSHQDTWNTDRHLAAVTAGMLRHLAQHGHTFPGEHNGWPDPSQWTQALFTHASQLQRYADSRNPNLIVDESCRTHNVDPDTLTHNSHPHVWETVEQLEQDVTSKAQQSLTWVAQQLPHLWD